MITVNNYNTKITQVDLADLPPALKKGHEMMEKGSANFYGKNEAITRVIDTYIDKLNQFVGSSKQVEKPERRQQEPPLIYKGNQLYKSFVKNVLPEDVLKSLKKYENITSGEYGDAIMRLSIEKQDAYSKIDFRGLNEKSYLLIIEHNYLQEGDLMTDPRIDYLVYPGLKVMIPINYEQNGIGKYVQYLNESGHPDLKGMFDTITFSKQWFKNLNEQGRNFLKTDSKKSESSLIYPKFIENDKRHLKFKEGDKVKAIGLPKEVDGVKNPLYNKEGTVKHSQPNDVKVYVPGYGSEGFNPDNLELVKTPKPKKKSTTKPKAKAKPAKSVKKTPSPAKKKATKKVAAKKTATPPKTHRTIKSPELMILTRFRNLPKADRTVRSIELFEKQISNGLKAEKYADHLSLVKEIQGKLKKLLGKVDKGVSKLEIAIDEKLLSKVNKAINNASERLRVSFMAGIDLFNQLDKLPKEVQAIIEKYSLKDENYEVMESFLKEMEAHGYTFEYGLDAIPFGLRKIGKK